MLPPDVTPATAVPRPATSTNNGPPESPLQVFESVPGGPSGAVKSQQMWLDSGTSVHADVTTLPRRLMPA